MRFVIPILLLLLTSCTKDTVPDHIEQIVHISHTRLSDNLSINQKAWSTNFSEFELVLLGGDLAHLSSQDHQTMDLLNDAFDLSSPQTLWTLGNHDYTDTSLIRSYTQRNNFYSHYQNGITYIVLDTQMDSCSMLNSQLALINNVTDTISESSHLVLLTHKLIWMVNHPVLHDQIQDVSNAFYEPFSHSLFDNNFYPDIYPKLVSVQNKGVNVICLAGDIGLFSNEFEYITPDGIQFLASGLNYGVSGEKYLTFEHNITQRSLVWKYQE